MKTRIIFCDKELIIEEKSKGTCLNYNQIIDISTNKPYVVISTLEKRQIYLEISLLELEKQLPPFFFRCNQSSIINLLFVNLYETKKKNYILYTVLGKNFTVSPKNKKNFKNKCYYLGREIILASG
jgi:DNA-binding LytR/AlgR family response regulator